LSCKGCRRRCIVPVDGFFEWKAIKGQRAKQPYSIAIKDGNPWFQVDWKLPRDDVLE
jgi:putative SOS response-associated peptidase YedK